MSFDMRGLTAEVRYGYRAAARIGPWRISDTVFDGQLIQADEMWLSRQPLSLWVELNRKFWVWREVELTGHTDRLTLCVSGSPEIRDA